MAALPAFLPQLLSNPSIQRALPAASGVPGLLFQHMSAAGLASGSTQGAFNAPPSCFASLLRQQYESVSPTAGPLSLHALAGKPLPGTGLMRRMAGGLAGGIAGGMAALSTLAAASGVVSVQSGEPGSEEVHAPDGSAQAESSLPADPSETPAMALQAAYMALVQASASPVIVTAVPRPESTGPGEGEQGAVTVIPAAPNPAAGASRLANAALSSAAVLVIDPALPLSAGAIAAGAAGAVGAATAEAISASTAEPAAAEAEADPVREAYEPGQVPGFPSGQSSAQDSGWPTGFAAAPTAGTAASITAAGGANTAPSGAAVPLAEGAFAAGGQPEPLPNLPPRQFPRSSLPQPAAQPPAKFTRAWARQVRPRSPVNRPPAGGGCHPELRTRYPPPRKGSRRPEPRIQPQLP
jgi:hypothetical protein